MRDLVGGHQPLPAKHGADDDKERQQPAGDGFGSLGPGAAGLFGVIDALGVRAVSKGHAVSPIAARRDFDTTLVCAAYSAEVRKAMSRG
jgi:hypothetical protein